jgi:hypothetical protein
MLKIPYYPDNRLTDAPAALYSPETYFFSVSGADVCQRLGKPQDLGRLEDKLKNSMTFRLVA